MIIFTYNFNVLKCISSLSENKSNVLDSMMENRRVQRNVNNNWSPWSAWSPCSEECMAGESQARSRQCLDKTGTSMADVRPCVEKVTTR